MYVIFLCNRSSTIYGKRRASEHLFRLPVISCVVEDSSETQPDAVNSSASSDSSKVLFCRSLHAL